MKIWERKRLDMPPSELQTTGYGFRSPKRRSRVCATLAVGPTTETNTAPTGRRIRDRVRARDKYQCQVCGAPETDRQHDVHHKIPFRIRSDIPDLKKPTALKISPRFAEPATRKWSKMSASAADLLVWVSCLATSRRSS